MEFDSHTFDNFFLHFTFTLTTTMLFESATQHALDHIPMIVSSLSTWVVHQCNYFLHPTSWQWWHLFDDSTGWS